MLPRLSDKIRARIVCLALVLAVMGGSWDIWWHIEVGRDTFWIPPHIMLYSGIVLSLCCAAHGWLYSKDKQWRRLTVALLAVPLAGPFDQFWHGVYGVEQLTSPFAVWAPPHLLLILGLFAGFALVLPLLARDDDVLARRLFCALSLGAMLKLLFILCVPLDPISGYHVIGFWGAGIQAAAVAFILVAGARYVGGIGAATSIVMVTIVLEALRLGITVSPDVIVNPQDWIPSFLIVFSLLAAALIIDVWRRAPVLAGTVAALAWAAITFGVATHFFTPAFQYGLSSIMVALLAALIGGYAAAAIASRIRF